MFKLCDANPPYKKTVPDTIPSYIFRHREEQSDAAISTPTLSS